MGTGGGADDVVGRPHVRHPIAHRFVERILEGLCSAAYGMHLRPEKLHSEDVELLSSAVLLAHVDFAVQAEKCAGGGGGDSMLPCARLRYDPLLAHAQG